MVKIIRMLTMAAFVVMFSLNAKAETCTLTYNELGQGIHTCMEGEVITSVGIFTYNEKGMETHHERTIYENGSPSYVSEIGDRILAEDGFHELGGTTTYYNADGSGQKQTYARTNPESVYYDTTSYEIFDQNKNTTSISSYIYNPNTRENIHSETVVYENGLPSYISYISDTIFSDDGHVYHKEETAFDNSGAKRIVETTYEDGKKQTQTNTSYFAGMIIQEKESKTYDENEREIASDWLVYNDDKTFRAHIISEYGRNEDGTQTSTISDMYDENGNKISYRYDTYYPQTEFGYTTKTSLSEEYYPDGSIKSSSSYEAREDGSDITSTYVQYFPDGNIKSLHAYEQDDNHTRLNEKQIYYDDDGNLEYSYLEDNYVRDEAGHITSKHKTNYNENDEMINYEIWSAEYQDDEKVSENMLRYDRPGGEFLGSSEYQMIYTDEGFPNEIYNEKDANGNRTYGYTLTYEMLEDYLQVTQIEYDSEGVTGYYIMREDSEGYIVEQYDSRDRKLMDMVYDYNEGKEIYTYYTRDEEGNLTSELKEVWGPDGNGETVILSTSTKTYNSDGSYSINDNGNIKRYDQDGQEIVPKSPKRIYTVEEAAAVVKPTGNTFKIRYK